MLLKGNILIPSLNVKDFTNSISGINLQDPDVTNHKLFLDSIINDLSSTGIDIYFKISFSRNNSYYKNSIRDISDEYSEKYGLIETRILDGIKLSNHVSHFMFYSNSYNYNTKISSKTLSIHKAQNNFYFNKSYQILNRLNEFFIKYIEQDFIKQLDDIIESEKVTQAAAKYTKKWFQQNLSESAKKKRRKRAVQSLAESFNTNKIYLKKEELVHLFSLLMKDRKAVNALCAWYGRNYKTRYALNEDIDQIINDAVDSATIMDILE